ncbi:hypothetical protein E4Z66_02705 [Aliishimia ponticola]|uniref:TonB-dependent receptor n=1 Tax=Aliishimia ponticola TaxID=2499833 RepID=A0A4S4NJQ1_9RHOB|nr:hypothetical protein [Aliishimia ponticola]THH38498.1 hypothetical protein E4Z66_02705 [Aliishimia ponticola]
MNIMYSSRFACLLLSTALVSLPRAADPQDCALPGGQGCQGDIAVTIPAAPNTERAQDVPDLSVDGFDISVDGAAVAQDGTITAGPPRRSARQRVQDIQLQSADVAVTFDGLGVRPRLALGAIGDRSPAPGQTVRLVNQMNYPAFVTRGELRVVEVDSRGRGRVVRTQALSPNGEVTVQAPPEGVTRYYSYRVYDARGRFDETQPLALDDLLGRGAPLIPTQNGDAVEEGIDTAYTRRIPVNGGAVTVTGTNMGAGRNVTTLGEQVRADESGTFVLQRILPTGDHLVHVDVAGGKALSRDVSIPSHDLFYVGIVDLTLHHTIDDDLADASGLPVDRNRETGRIAFYLKGKIKGDVLLTAALDTGEEELGHIFSNLDEKNPRSLIDRIDPDEYYPVYGDDSTSIDDAPTSGKFYVRLEKDASHVVWGTFRSEVGGTEYLRNDRTLYGLQGVYRSKAQTEKGHSRVEAQVYGAQPDTLPQRDVFLGTGGSVYFLQFQDITRGSETLQVEIQDPDTGRVITRRTLVYGVDYDINYVQGLVTLRTPLSGTASDGDLITTSPSGDNNAYLVATYEHTPTLADLDTFSYGGRVQTWATDDLRLGVTVQHEDLGTADQDAYGADILYQPSDRTYLSFEYARTDGRGVDESISVDGGLTGAVVSGITGDGRAYKFNGQADLQELGFGMPGLIGGYFEDRTAGFSTLSYRSANDERLYGLFVELDPSERVSLRFDFDHYEDSAGREITEGGLAVGYQLNERVGLTFGVEHTDEERPGFAEDTGRRTDLALRADVVESERFRWYGYVHGTAEVSGGLERNNRVGLGAEWAFAKNWTALVELSEGNLGTGAQFRFSHADEIGNTTYFGYALDPGRELDGLSLTGKDRGRFVAGATRKINEDVTITGENSYDLFGSRRALTSLYGANYVATERLTFDAAFELGRVTDDIANTDFDRKALSLGATYEDEGLTWRGRIELRRDEGLTSGSDRDADTIAGSFHARYKISESARLLFAIEGVTSDNASASIPDAEYGELTLGYAFRPVDNDRLNILAKYQYVYDMTERSGFTAPSGSNFLTTPRQKAHILSLDSSYDLNPNWTVGGKVGGRWSEQDFDGVFTSNNATLGVLNLRYHAVHKWDFLLEARQLRAEDVGSQFGLLAAAYRHVGNNLKVGVGFNDGAFSDDLSDVTYDDRGVFLNIVGKF